MEPTTALPPLGSVIRGGSGGWLSRSWGCRVVRIITMSPQPNKSIAGSDRRKLGGLRLTSEQGRSNPRSMPRKMRVEFPDIE